MAENIKLTLEVDKDIVKYILAMSGGLKDNTPSSIVKEWINEHDSVELPASVISDSPELGVAMAMIVLLGILNELKKDKEK
jgi:hypothetical protein